MRSAHIAALGLLTVLATSLLPIADAEALQCGTFSAHSRRCFVSFFQPCKQAGRDDKTCHAQADSCRGCNEKLFACWKTLKDKAQCGTCAKVYDTCMHPVVERQNKLSKTSKAH